MDEAVDGLVFEVGVATDFHPGQNKRKAKAAGCATNHSAKAGSKWGRPWCARKDAAHTRVKDAAKQCAGDNTVNSDGCRLGVHGVSNANAPSRQPMWCRRGHCNLGLVEGGCLSDHFINPADHIEGLLRKVIILARKDCTEGLNCVFTANELTSDTGKCFTNEEWLGQEALNLTCT